jgi:hypothetical protein
MEHKRGVFHSYPSPRGECGSFHSCQGAAKGGEALEIPVGKLTEEKLMASSASDHSHMV